MCKGDSHLNEVWVGGGRPVCGAVDSAIARGPPEERVPRQKAAKAGVSRLLCLQPGATCAVLCDHRLMEPGGLLAAGITMFAG